MKKLIYLCCFQQESFTKLVQLLVDSLEKHGNVNTDTDVLIQTSENLVPILSFLLQSYKLNILYRVVEIQCSFDAFAARFLIFEYDTISKYEKILYLDADILIHGDVESIFARNISDDKLYALEEGSTNHDFWGGQFFSDDKVPQSAFTTGALLFKNSESMKTLFYDIRDLMTQYLKAKLPYPPTYDQPFVVYQAITQGKYDNQMFKEFMINNPTELCGKIIYHFPAAGGIEHCGHVPSKFEKMTEFARLFSAT